jgi:outer membrane receptor protein involved in Fe transport
VYGVGYQRSKLESELSGRESFTGDGSVGLDTTASFEVDSLSIPVAGRLNITDKLRGFAGARFDYTTTEFSDFDRFGDGSTRAHSEEKHTNTSYAVGLRYDYNEHLSAEVGMLRASGSEDDRDEVRGDSLSFGLNFSF